MPRGYKYASEDERRLAQLAATAKYRKANAAKVRAWRRSAHARNRESYNAMNRSYKLRAAYGMSLSDYEGMLASQDGRCAICEGTNPSGKRLAVDHSHATDAVRGLLCSRCNTMIGHACDDVDILLKAVGYLRRFA
jgi:hypothetical protein